MPRLLEQSAPLMMVTKLTDPGNAGTNVMHETLLVIRSIASLIFAFWSLKKKELIEICP